MLAHGWGPSFSGQIISRPSLQDSGLDRRATPTPTDHRGRPEAERQQRDEHLREGPPDPELLDAEPLTVGQPAVRDGQILAPEAPRETVDLLRLQLGARHVLRLRIEDTAVLVDKVIRPGLEDRFAVSFHVPYL